MNLMIWLATITERLWQAWAYLSSGRTLVSLLGIGFAVLAILLLVAGKTRWGHSKPLTKCIVLSILAHVWLLMYALGSRPVLPQGDPNGKETGLVMAFESLTEFPAEMQTSPIAEELPEWEQPVPLANLPLPPELMDSNDISWKESPDILSEVDVTPLTLLPAVEGLPDQDQHAP